MITTTYLFLNTTKKRVIITSLTKMLSIILFICCLATWVTAQTDTAMLRADVEAHPDSLSAHEDYINAFRKSIPGASYGNSDSVLTLLVPQYSLWMHQFPQYAVVPFALGDAYANAESPKAKPYLLKAIEIDPKFAKAYFDLSIDADRWGDSKVGNAYLLKAKEADPDNPDYAFYYAISFQNSNPARWRTMLYDLIKQFPKSERGAQGLYWLAFGTNVANEKVKIYEQLRNLYPPDKFGWSNDGMDSYFQLLLKTDPAKAIYLAKYMSGLKSENVEKKEWEKNLALAEKIDKAHLLLNKHQAVAAMKILSGVTVNRWSDALESVNLLKAESVTANGNIRAAYDSLLLFYAKSPHDETRVALLQYGAKLKKNETQVNQDVWKQRDMTAKTAHPFKLKDYLTGDSVSLSDFRGKVVLLTFWFPGCGPCRGEFPHFQKILNEFKGENITFLGINVSPDQNEYVVPFMKGTGYSFIPLESNSDWAQNAYGVRGEPTNFLIDGNGKIIFTGFMIQDEQEEQMLRLMISSMVLKRKA